MKWTKELDDKLEKFLKDGKKYEDIAILMKTTTKSVACRSNRIGLKIIHHKEYKCKNCDILFVDFINSERIFCSHKCSASYNNKNRIISDETKNKIRLGMNNYYSKKEIKIVNPNIKDYNNNKDMIKSIKLPKEKRCKECNELFNEKYKSICKKCHEKYYKYYRPLCEFNFNLNDYKSKFDIKLLEKYGRYSPTNKGNNLNGVSKDHMFSVKDGFLNNISPSIIKHPANCQLLKHTDNNLKNTQSIITLQNLIDRIKEWESTT